jgi:uncharacterized protein (TIGR00251 family)
LEQACLRRKDESLLLDVKVSPGASNDALAGESGGRLRVRVAAAPEDGKANERLCSFLAKLLGCPKKDVRVLSGEKSRLKTLMLPLSCLEAARRLTSDAGVQLQVPSMPSR